jgi:DnaJ homolog subfamily C member 19
VSVSVSVSVSVPVSVPVSVSVSVSVPVSVPVSVVCRLSSVVCRLSSVVCRLSSVVCRLSSVVCRLSSVSVSVPVVCRLSLSLSLLLHQIWPLAVGVGIACIALGGRAIMNAMKQYRGAAGAAAGAAATAAANAAAAAAGAGPTQKQDQQKKGFFGSFGKKYYEGGFDEKMTRREAALILGCRESAPRDKILQRYRLLMKLNHPDLGGSPFVSTKINEAKEMLVGKGNR